MISKTIGVFDSGVGGLSFVNAIKTALPDNPVIYVEDKDNIPYGSKTKKQLSKLVTPIIKDLAKKCDLIVVACNTVSTLLIEELREKVNIPLIAVEPMVKPAAVLSKTGIIAVCATPATLGSPRYRWLKNNYAKGVKVIEPDCSTWSTLIESNKTDQLEIENEVKEVLDAKADVIVLGCTHYHWIEEEIRGCAKGRAKVLQPEQAVISQVEHVLKQLS